MADVVWTITDLGPTDGEGLVMQAELAGRSRGFGPVATWRFDEWSSRGSSYAQYLDDYARYTDAKAREAMTRHTNNRCTTEPA